MAATAMAILWLWPERCAGTRTLMSVSHTLNIFHMTSHTKHPVRVGPVGGVGVTARRQAIALGIGGHPWDPLTLQPATNS